MHLIMMPFVLILSGLVWSGPLLPYDIRITNFTILVILISYGNNRKYQNRQKEDKIHHCVQKKEKNAVSIFSPPYFFCAHDNLVFLVLFA